VALTRVQRSRPLHRAFSAVTQRGDKVKAYVCVCVCVCACFTKYPEQNASTMDVNVETKYEKRDLLHICCISGAIALLAQRYRSRIRSD